MRAGKRIGKRRGNALLCPPSYRRIEHTMEHFGDIRHDPYHWLRDRQNPEVQKLLKRENAHMESVYKMYGGSRLSRTLFNEMRARWKEEDASLPYRDRNYWYYTRSLPNVDHPIFCRRPFTDETVGFVEEVAALWAEDATASLPHYDNEVVFLDVNLLIKELQLESVELGDMDISPNEQQLAVALDCSKGKEVYTILILDITNVNYLRWLQGQSEMHRAWVDAMLKRKQSIYSSPTSAFPPHFNRKISNVEKRTPKSSSGVKWGNALALHSFTVSVPAHKITRKIDIFDAAGELLWINQTALLYIGLDSKMRSCRVIYHDLSLPEASEEADVVCYEEQDEAFWVCSLGFSADERFVTFTSSSGESSEVYIIPCDADIKRCITGVPLMSLETLDTHEREKSMKCDGKNNCAIFRFSDRQEPLDYEIDHHESLFGDAIGAWVVVITNARPGHGNFQVACVLDEDILLQGDGKLVLTHPSQWRTLCTYDPDISVEDVECQRDYLLLDVRRAASATVLLLPIHKLWSRWRNRIEGQILPLSLSDDAVDLSGIVKQLPSTLSELCFPLTELRTEEKEEGRLVSLMSCTGDTYFGSRTWRISVMHLTVPGIILGCRLTEMAGEDMLYVTRLCDTIVNGAPYRAEDYDAAIVWVPSDYAFRAERQQLQIHPLPTEESAEVVRIPLYVCWKKALRRHGENPMYLTVYGSYGDCCDVGFESERVVLLDRGFVWAMAGVRGGGELGISWRDAGRKLQRATTVNDFVSVSSYVQETGWCAVGRLVTSGASAGGFVVAAAMNVAPSLPLAVVASVPFLDCLTTLLDPDLPLTISDWEEFGNPLDDADAYKFLRAISPMDNVPPRGVALPHILLQTAWKDTRVGYWESLAFIARLRYREDTSTHPNYTTTVGKRCLLHYCDFGAGHGGASGRYQQLKEIAREYAFTLLVQKAAENDYEAIDSASSTGSHL